MKEFLKKFPSVFMIMKFIKNINNRDYIESHLDLDYNYNMITLEKSSNGVNNDLICEIDVANKNEGFFAAIRWALDALYFCDYYNLKPIIKFEKESLYFDYEYGQEKNPFEYYFNQPLGLSIEDLENAKTITKISNKYYNFAESLNGGLGYVVTEEYIDAMAKILKKYLIFNEDTENKINQHIQKLNLSDKILGVHIRGTDYKKKYKDHPVFVETESYYQYIDEALEKHKFEKIFLATDDEDILLQMIEHYGEDKIIFSKDTQRAKGENGVHVNKNSRKYDRYLLGLEVIFDMCSLAKCGGIISGMSQVSRIARIYKKSKEKTYIYDKTLSKGINKKGKIFKTKKI